jgi:hypothetical protein
MKTAGYRVALLLAAVLASGSALFTAVQRSRETNAVFQKGPLVWVGTSSDVATRGELPNGPSQPTMPLDFARWLAEQRSTRLSAGS